MTTEKTGFSASLRRAVPLLAILAAALAGYFFLGDYLSFETLRDNRDALIVFRDHHYWLAVGGYVGVYVLIVAFSLPGAAVATLTGGFLFGLFPGALYTISAATTGAILIFLAARLGMGEQLSKRMDASQGVVGQIKAGLRENELSYLFLMRLIPAIPFFLANLIPALVGVGLSRFAFTTFFGIIPGSVVYTWVGVGLGDVFARDETPDFGLIFQPQILGPILGLVLLAVLPVIFKKLNKKEKA